MYTNDEANLIAVFAIIIVGNVVGLCVYVENNKRSSFLFYFYLFFGFLGIFLLFVTHVLCTGIKAVC